MQFATALFVGGTAKVNITTLLLQNLCILVWHNFEGSFFQIVGVTTGKNAGVCRNVRGYPTF